MTISLQHQIALVNYGNYFIKNQDINFDLLNKHLLLNQYADVKVALINKEDNSSSLIAENIFTWFAYLIANNATGLRLVNVMDQLELTNPLTHSAYLIEAIFPNKVHMYNVHWQTQGSGFSVSLLSYADILIPGKRVELSIENLKKELGIKLHILQTIFAAINEPIWRIQLQAAELALSKELDWDAIYNLTPRCGMPQEHAKVLSSIYIACGFESDLGEWGNIAVQLKEERNLFEQHIKDFKCFAANTLMYLIQ